MINYFLDRRKDIQKLVINSIKKEKRNKKICVRGI